MRLFFVKILDHVNTALPGKNIPLVFSLLCLITAAVYGNVFNSSFVNYDDPLYLLERPEVQGGITFESIRWAFTSMSEGNWIPLTWLSYMLDVSLFGINARGHHAVNLLFHLINTTLLLIFLYRMTGRYWRSIVVAALFALHPLHVESVAWIAERKDVLSGCFFMLTLLAYHNYIKNPVPGRYLIVVICYCLGLCSKSMLVTLPFLLLVLDYWPLGRYGCRSDVSLAIADAGEGSTASFRNLLVEKIPLFIPAFAVLYLTFGAQKRIGAVQAASHGSLAENLSAALVNYVTYIYKTVVPINLAAVYPFNAEIPLWQPFAAAMLLLAVTLLVFRFRHGAPYILTGWLWFTGTLVPVIGVIRLGDQSVADRYTYIPLIGLFIILVWGSDLLAERLQIKRRVKFAVVTAVVGVLCCLSWVQVGYWQDSATLFRHAIRVTEENWIAYNKLAGALLENGDVKQADACAKESLRINPRNPFVYLTLGQISQNSLDHEQAIDHYIKAVQIAPRNDMAHFLLGRSFVVIGDVGSAMSEYNILLGLNRERAAVLLIGIIQMQKMRR